MVSWVARLEESINRLLVILKLVVENPGLSITDIAEKLGLNKTSVSQSVDLLVRLGWVRKQVGGMPRRAIVSPTEKGACVAKCINT